LTFMVGQLQSLETPSLNLVFDDDTVAVYLADLGNGEFTIHCATKVEVTHNVLKHYNEIFSFIVLGLMSRGFEHIDTWVENDPRQFNFATFFGFEETGFLRAITSNDGQQIVLREMRYVFPVLDEED
jgi:hypothetical protein